MRAATLMLIFGVGFTICAEAADSNLDLSFGVGGIAILGTAPLYPTGSVAPLIEAEGTIITCAAASLPIEARYAGYVFGLTPNGAPDPTFGSGGAALLDTSAPACGSTTRPASTRSARC
jgi:hypothetical protein